MEDGKMKVLFFSAYNRRSWDLKEVLLNEGAEVLWAKTAAEVKSLKADGELGLAVVDIEKFSIEMLSDIGFQTPIVLLADTDENVYAEFENVPELHILNRNGEISEFRSIVQKHGGKMNYRRNHDLAQKLVQIIGVMSVFHFAWIQKALPFLLR